MRHSHAWSSLSPPQSTQPLASHAYTHPAAATTTNRLEEAQEAAAGLREQLTDARKRLREVLDEEKELKKRRRATALALATVRL